MLIFSSEENRLHPINFFIFILFIVITFIGISYPSPMSLLPLIFVFVMIPILDAIIGKDVMNPSDEQEKKWRIYRVWAPATYLYTLTHFAVLYYGITLSPSLQWGELLMIGLIVGLYTGGLGITVAHELCHRRERLPKFLAELLLSSVWYHHFATEHVRGHHLHVATDDDPASARFNEGFYPFFLRTVIGSFTSALKIDSSSVARGILLSTIWTVGCFYYNPMAGVFFLAQAIIAITLLELVNYVEHYGLKRKKLENGRYEKVQPQHSWNSAHRFSNALLFNLQKHSDHHAAAHLPYTVLKHQHSAPQLPSGYPGMILLALIPPLWFKVMNPRLAIEQGKLN
jgi:alkane 1-monooxygenase